MYGLTTSPVTVLITLSTLAVNLSSLADVYYEVSALSLLKRETSRVKLTSAALASLMSASPCSRRVSLRSVSTCVGQSSVTYPSLVSTDLPGPPRPVISDAFSIDYRTLVVEISKGTYSSSELFHCAKEAVGHASRFLGLVGDSVGRHFKRVDSGE